MKILVQVMGKAISDVKLLDEVSKVTTDEAIELSRRVVLEEGLQVICKYISI
ncbi:hypothetical protein SLEP1_g39376 [Rubroshorea leprosula]|uniref:Uncharacterized protein n=1 Tax=Rubroshorea leprosula TaxID=152421 RepID=A0AAV5L0D7_9ROSI|nr:hypothetical protein SLEP1_g39376 [Rubroshorea leprosula]